MKKLIYAFTLLSFSIYALDTFNGADAPGGGKYNRIGHIEKYLTSFTSEYKTDLETKFSKLEKKISSLESRIKSPKKNNLLDQIRKEMRVIKKELSDQHADDLKKVREEIKKAIKDQDTKREALAKGLLNRMLTVEKVLHGFGKVKSI